ncbi:conserved Plasmodium protein, unknown function [Plasmodium gallinaceum]|uniref:Uncharacterized protein n=1 Tax=Plasmodium gallinaceum TaxID=5849 RepID=A0A1J1GZ78_PLAGA|nr:conserved Plasmodium protein, unknown function [Plasmodium gallinaceum]CRG97900.1 conserved Plasmodium protein, unknown function [Plasmodium gallinaceum]
MEKLTYLNEYTRIFEFVKNGALFEDQHTEKIDNSCSYKEKNFSHVKRKSKYISMSKLKEKNSSKKLNFYKDNENKYQVSKIKNIDKYLLLSATTTPNLTPKNKNKLDNLKNEMKFYKLTTSNDRMKCHNKVCVCKRCYIKGIQEEIEKREEKKKRTTVYTLEFNNFINKENIYEDISKRQKITKPNSVNERKYSDEYNRECNEVIVEKLTDQIPLKKNIFHFLNYIFKIN